MLLSNAKRYIVLTLTAGAIICQAAPIDEAKRLYNEGDYAAAAEQCRKIIKRTPRDGNANYYLGASLIASGKSDEARKPLETAGARGVADAWRLLAVDALDNYRADEASANLESWQRALTKAKKDIPDQLEAMQRRAVMLRNMLERVERIEILDSMSVDSADFFNAYRLSAAAGRIMPPEAVRRAGAGSSTQTLSPAYMPQNNSELIWAATDSCGVFSLYSADILDDGTLDHTQPLGDNLAGGGNASFPFLMPDGVTLYFASDGENSLGGYDIFMTRQNDNNDDGNMYYNPQNIGLPYNSPYNDYMLAIDEASGLGWWATDRNSEPDKVTVYVYAPSAMRVNVSPSDPDLLSLARLDNIALTRNDNTDYTALLQERLPKSNEQEDNTENRKRFAIDMGNGKIYTSPSDFKNDRARSAMLEALATGIALQKHLAAEEALREKYRQGDRSVKQAILDSESETARLRRLAASQRNKAIRLERGN